MKRRHVNLIDIGALLAIDLDADEQFIHQRGDRIVFETFMRHHMAPMAGRVTNGEEHRLFRAARFIEGVGTPFPPRDGIVLMLQQIGARGFGQAVHAMSPGRNA